jgi:hypothetical protein
MYLKIKIHHDAEEKKENTGFSKTSFKNSFIRTWSIGSDL